MNTMNTPCLSNFASVNPQTFAQESEVIYDLDLASQIFEQPSTGPNPNLNIQYLHNLDGCLC